MSSNINSVSDEEFTDSNSSVEFTLNSTDDSLQSNETLVADNKSTLPKSGEINNYIQWLFQSYINLYFCFQI